MRARPLVLSSLLLALALCVVAHPAAAQDAEPGVAVEPAPAADVRAVPERPRETVGRLTLRFAGGFAGDFEQTPRSVALDGSESVRDPVEEALEPALGGHVQFEIPVVGTWLQLGFWVGVVTWKSDIGEDLELERNSWLDVDATVRGQLELVDGLIELYLLVPVGLTVNRFSEKVLEHADVPWGHGPGVNFGAIAGIGFDLGGHGLFVDVGWLQRRFFHDSAGTTFGTPVSFELDGVTNQVHVGAGLFFDL